jgi:hypothetical protein
VQGTTILKLFTSKRARNKLIERFIEIPRSIRKADYVFVSYPKSGRTWVRAMLTRLYHSKYGIPDNLLIRLDNLHKIDSRIPIIFFTHDGDSSVNVNSLSPDKSVYDGKNIILLARHPGDVIVSMYYHHKHRKSSKRENFARDSDLFSFATRPDHGIHTVIAFMNHWLNYVRDNPKAQLVRYEDLRADPRSWLKKITDHFGGDFTLAEIQDAVTFAEFDNLQKLERDRYFADKHLQPVDDEDLGSYKVRSGKVGDYKSHFTEQQIRQIESILAAELDTGFGY